MKLSNSLNLLFKKLNTIENLKLAPLTTFNIGGPASFFITINEIKDLKELTYALQEQQIPFHILGGGSNTLVSDQGYNGVIIKLGSGFNKIENIKKDSLTCFASTSFAKVTKLCIEIGFKSALGWAGTPGVMGGAIYMNAGSKNGEIKDVVERVFGILDGQEICFYKDEINFSYRKSSFPKNFIITKIDLKSNILTDINLIKQKYEELKDKRKKTQPTTNSAGSFFKNPENNFAAKLIEDCGLKGKTSGMAQISNLHANFLINLGGASAQNVIELGKLARKKVYETYGILLETEVLLLGEFDKKDPFMWN